MSMSRTFVALAGLFLTIEGTGNLLFWYGRSPPLLFQLGRGFRVAVGIALIVISFVGGI